MRTSTSLSRVAGVATSSSAKSPAARRTIAFMSVGGGSFRWARLHNRAPLALGPLRQQVLPGASHLLEKFDAPETDGRPILIDRHHADRLEALGAKDTPTSVTVDL